MKAQACGRILLGGALETSHLSVQTTMSSLLIPDTLWLPLRGSARTHDHYPTLESLVMSKSQLAFSAAISLAVGGLLGLAGSFSPPAIRGIAWGLDGTALVMGGLLLDVHHMKLGNEQLAAGFFTFVAGQTLVVSSSAMDLAASSPSFGAGVGLWAAGLALVSASSAMPIVVRATGAIASVMFAIVALQIFGGTALTPLSNPLPFNAYPFLVLTLFGWAWVHYRRTQDTA